MIKAKLVAKVESLLKLGTLSQRQIALEAGVSRGAVSQIASGKRPDYELLRRLREEEDAYLPPGPKGRCSHCGGQVFLPCLACQLRESLPKSSKSQVIFWLTALKEPLGLKLREEHQQRYEEIRAQKLHQEKGPENGLKKMNGNHRPVPQTNGHFR